MINATDLRGSFVSDSQSGQMDVGVFSHLTFSSHLTSLTLHPNWEFGWIDPRSLRALKVRISLILVDRFRQRVARARLDYQRHRSASSVYLLLRPALCVWRLGFGVLGFECGILV